eukprot:1771338-Ditylum_brightwellii.AAC.1
MAPCRPNSNTMARPSLQRMFVTSLFWAWAKHLNILLINTPMVTSLQNGTHLTCSNWLTQPLSTKCFKMQRSNTLHK